MTAASLAPMTALPTRRDEAWRYAPHQLLAQLSFGAADESPTPLADDVLAMVPALDGPRVVVVNGVVDRTLSREVEPVNGVTVTAGSTDDHLGPSTLPGELGPRDGYLVRNSEFGRDAVVINVAAGVEVATPIHVVTVALGDEHGRIMSTRNRIHLGAGSSATVVETRIGIGSDPGGSSVRTIVSLDAGATLDHIVIQDLPSSQVHLGRVEVEQAETSSLRCRSFNLGAAYGRLEYHVALNGPDALADLAGLFFGTGDQVLDQQLTVIHVARDCRSLQTFRGVLDDHSTGVFNGGIDVRPGADGTDASQSNHNLLLSNRAEINTQPRLEILADEVSCAHGATVGQLDETALYYLRSRGIPVATARRLLINGFADEIVNDTPNEQVRAWISRRLGHDHHGTDHHGTDHDGTDHDGTDHD